MAVTLQRPRFSPTPTLAMPEIRVGKTTVSGQGWVTIPFGYTFQQEPSVVCVSERRAGVYQPLTFEAPIIDLPPFDPAILLPELPAVTAANITLPTLTIPKITFDFNPTIPNVREEWADAAVIQMKNALNSIRHLFPVPINLIATWLIDVPFAHIAYHSAYAQANQFMGALEWLKDEVTDLIVTPVKNYLDDFRTDVNKFSKDIRVKTEEAINQVIGDILTASQEGLITLRDGTQQSFNSLASATEGLRDSTQTAINEVSAQATAALNQSIDLLWTTLGLEEGALMSPISLRNVGISSFEVWGLGGDMTVHWIAATGMLVDGGENGNGNGEPPLDPWGWIPDWLKNLFPTPTSTDTPRHLE